MISNDSNRRPFEFCIFHLPGWHGSGPDHWQTTWESCYSDQRVEQHDWLWPRRGDWMARLDEVVQRQTLPVIFVAHSLGCQLAASWSAASSHTAKVRGALLVAPADPERDDTAPQLYNWRPVSTARIPFSTTIVCSSDDPFCSSDRAARFASDWGSELIAIGAHGHINADSGLGAWPAGRHYLEQLIARVR